MPRAELIHINSLSQAGSDRFAPFLSTRKMEWICRAYFNAEHILEEKVGSRVHKVSVNAAFTCPNRDGTKGIGGCALCNNSSFLLNPPRWPPFVTRFSPGRPLFVDAPTPLCFMALRSPYTNTYADLETLPGFVPSGTQCGACDCSRGHRTRLCA